MVLGWPYADGSIDGVDGWAVTAGSYVTAGELMNWVSAVGDVNRAHKTVTPTPGSSIIEVEYVAQFTASGNESSFDLVFQDMSGDYAFYILLYTDGFTWYAKVGNETHASAPVEFIHEPFRRDTVHARYDGALMTLSIAGVDLISFPASGYNVSDMTLCELKAIVSTGVNHRFVNMAGLSVGWFP